jgi:hypothetical protein
MINILMQFEKALTKLEPQALLILAAVTLAAGAFIYLGGFGFRKLMFAVIGTCCGIGITLLTFGLNIMLMLAFVGICVMLALKMQDSFLVLVTSIFAAIYGFSVLIRPYFGSTDDLMAVMRELTIGVPYYNWPMLIAFIALPVALNSTFYRAGSAILCAIAGTVVVLAGGVILAKHLGYNPASQIAARSQIYLGIFAAAAFADAIVQGLILPKISSRFAAVKESSKAKTRKARKRKTDETAGSKSTAWRTA